MVQFFTWHSLQFLVSPLSHNIHLSKEHVLHVLLRLHVNDTAVISVLLVDVILQESVHARAMRAVGTLKERLHLAEVVHVFLQAAPVAEDLTALQTAAADLALAPHLARQSATIEQFCNSQSKKKLIVSAGSFWFCQDIGQAGARSFVKVQTKKSRIGWSLRFCLFQTIFFAIFSWSLLEHSATMGKCNLLAVWWSVFIFACMIFVLACKWKADFCLSFNASNWGWVIIKEILIAKEMMRNANVNADKQK